MENMLHTTPTLSHEINNYLTIIYSQLQHIEHLYKYLSKDEHWIRMKEDFSSAFRLLQELMEEENLTDSSLYQTISDTYKNRSAFVQAMEHSPLSNAVDTIIGLIEECAGQP